MRGFSNSFGLPSASSSFEERHLVVPACNVAYQLDRGALLHYSDTPPRGIKTVDDGRPGGNERPLHEVEKVSSPCELSPDRLPEVNRSVAVGTMDGDKLVSRTKHHQEFSSGEAPHDDFELVGGTTAASGKLEQAKP